MRISVFPLVFLLSVFCAPCAAAQPSGPVQVLSEAQVKKIMPDKSREIGLSAFLEMRKQGGAVVIDLREKEAFAQKHIAGSVNIPLTMLTQETLATAAPDKTADIVLVCDNSFFPTRRIAMTLQAWPVLAAAGYAHVFRLNLWQGAKNGMPDKAEIEKAVSFEGAAVPPKSQKPADDAFSRDAGGKSP
jgi:hypothetical protein